MVSIACCALAARESTRLRMVPCGRADDCRVRIRGEVADLGRVPVISARQMIDGVHALLHDRPFAGAADDESVQIELKAVGDGVVVDLRRQPTGARQRFAIKSCAGGEAAKFLGRAARVPTATSADVTAPSREKRGLRPRFNAPMHRRGDAGGVPIHAHHSSRRPGTRTGRSGERASAEVP